MAVLKLMSPVGLVLDGTGTSSEVKPKPWHSSCIITYKKVSVCGQ